MPSWLLDSLRVRHPSAHSRWRDATLETIRRTFVKIAVHAEDLTLPPAYPHQAMLATVTITASGPDHSVLSTHEIDRQSQTRPPSWPPWSWRAGRAMRRHRAGALRRG